MTRIHWSVARALDLSDEEIRRAEIRAARIEESYRPDGAVEYVPETEAYAVRHFVGRRTLRRLRELTS